MKTQGSDREAAGSGRRQPPPPQAPPVAGAPDGWSRDQAEQAFLEHLQMIQRVIATVARQHRLSADDAEEFSSMVLLRIISDDYAVLRKFREQCRLRTFLTVVVQRLCLDFRAAQWGKWRPAVHTRRRGDVAILLERLTMRDGLSFDEAFEMMRTNYQLALDRDTLARIHAGFRRRLRPRMVSEEEIGELPTAGRAPDHVLHEAEENNRLAAATAVLATALAELEPRDRLILQLRFANGMVVADIGRMLQIDYKWIFRRIDRLMKTLRGRLESEGVRAADVLPALGYLSAEVIDVLRDGASGSVTREPVLVAAAPVKRQARAARAQDWAGDPD